MNFRRLLILCGWLSAAALGLPVQAATATRALPAHFTPGIPFTVTLSTAPDASTHVYAVEETPPADWPISAISHGGSFDSVNGLVKWGPFLDATPRTLTFEVTPPVSATGEHVFQGEAAFDSTRLVLGGAQGTARFPGTLTRSQPASYLPGIALTVTLTATPATDVEAWAVEELVPAGWAVAAITAGGGFDTLNRKVKWGPFFDTAPRSLGYTLTPPASARAPAGLTAVAQFDAAALTATASVPAAPSTLERSAPSTYSPGVAFTVTLTASPAPFVQVLAVEEQLLVGWTPVAISAGGVFDSANSILKWGPFTDGLSAPVALSYQLVPPAGLATSLALTARGLFDDLELTSPHEVIRFLANPDSSVVRSLPAHYMPGAPVAVSLQASPIDTAFVYAVEESIPAGWTIASLSSGGVFDSVNRLLKWGPFFDGIATPRTLAYSATPPADAFGEVTFLGTARFDQTVLTVSGASLLANHPATVTRTSAARYTPGVPLAVTLSATPVPGVKVYAIEEEVPGGWTVTGLTDGGAVDPFSHHIKWGPFTDRNLRTLTYTLTAPPDATGPHTLVGHGFFHHDSVDITGATTLLRNAPPSALPDVINRRPGEPAKLSVFLLLANDTDPEGDFIQIRNVASTSALGGAVQMVWPWIYYTPPPGPDAPDSFTYAVGDPFGGSATASLSILIGSAPQPPAQNIISIQSAPGGHRLIRFACIPGLVYHVEASPDLTIWTRLGDATAGATGEFLWDDAEADLHPVRFYRSTWP